MPASHRLPPQSQPSTSLPQRGLAWLVVLFVALQALSVPALRTAERAHFHLAKATVPAAFEAVVQTVRDGRLVEPFQSDHDSNHAHHDSGDRVHGAVRTAGLFRHKRDVVAQPAAPHRHTDVAVHGHVPGWEGVVYVDAQQAFAPAPKPPPKRVAFDIDAVGRLSPAIAQVPVRQPRDTEVGLSLRSRTWLPLERPPRARA